MPATLRCAAGLILSTGLLFHARAQSMVLYRETFDTGPGRIRIANGGDASAGWRFDDSCPPAVSAPGGHGVLRWGSFADCFAYGEAGHADTASTDEISLPAGATCHLSFRYNLEYEEPVSFEGSPELSVIVDGGEPRSLLGPAGGSWTADGRWRSIRLPLPDGRIRIDFIGSTDDGAFNSGTGWTIDDVEVSCEPSRNPSPPSP